MMSTSNPGESQLRWRCRRGMLELDLLLNRFLKLEYIHLSQDEIESFLLLLDFSDQDLLDLFFGKVESDDALVSSLVLRIRNAYYGELVYSKNTVEGGG